MKRFRHTTFRIHQRIAILLQHMRRTLRLNSNSKPSNANSIEIARELIPIAIASQRWSSRARAYAYVC